MKLIGNNHSFSHTIKYLFCFGLLTLLASCGGGSSSDRSPDAFSFTAQTDVALSSPIDSNTVTITSINKATDISVTGGGYSIGGGTFTSASGTVTENQSVVVRVTSSANNSTTTTATLTVGDKTGSFSVTTLADSIPDAFSFTDQADAFFNRVITSDEITLSGIDIAVDISIADGEYSIDGGEFISTAGTINNAQTVSVRMTSGGGLGEETTTTLTISGIVATFSTTTHTADASGIFNGNGTVNNGTMLAEVKSIIREQRFMMFNEAENILYDGQIQSYEGDTFTATVDVYKDGVNGQTANATGTIANQLIISMTLTGTGYGSGTIDLTYDAIYERDATFEQFFLTGNGNFWAGSTHSVNNGQPFEIQAATDDTFTGGPMGVSQCSYDSGMKGIPDANFNLYAIDFDSEHRNTSNCDHVGTGFSGFVTIIDQGTTDGTMWFAGTNGVQLSL